MLLSSLLACSPARSASDVPRAALVLKRDFVRAHRQVWGVENPAFLAAQIEAESRWIDGQTSSAGARGICQAIEPTAAALERRYSDLAGLGRYSIHWCLLAGARLMREEFERYLPGRGRCSALLFAASAYNGGPTRLNAEVTLCEADQACDPSRWFGHVSSKRSRSWAAWNENRPYTERIFTREPAYADAGFGVLTCR